MISPFAGFTGGLNVATGDVTGDGTPDVVAGGGPDGSPQVVVFDSKTDAQVRSFFAFETSFTGGVGVSAGDTTGDGRADILVSAGVTGGPRVSLFSGADGSLVANLFAYSDQLRGGGQRREREADRLRWEEQERLRREEAERERAERARVEKLLADAESWRRADAVRRYVRVEEQLARDRGRNTGEGTELGT